MSPSEPILIWGAGAIGGTPAAMAPSDPILFGGAGQMGGTPAPHGARAGALVLLAAVGPGHVGPCPTGGLEISGRFKAFGVATPAVEPHDVPGTYRRIVL